MKFLGKWVELENVILSEETQSQNNLLIFKVTPSTLGIKALNLRAANLQLNAIP